MSSKEKRQFVEMTDSWLFDKATSAPEELRKFLPDERWAGSGSYCKDVINTFVGGKLDQMFDQLEKEHLKFNEDQQEASNKSKLFQVEDFALVKSSTNLGKRTAKNRKMFVSLQPTKKMRTQDAYRIIALSDMGNKQSVIEAINRGWGKQDKVQIYCKAKSLTFRDKSVCFVFESIKEVTQLPPTS